MRRRQPPRTQIQLPAGEAKRTPAIVALRQRRLYLIAAQHGTYPRKQFARAEWLGDIVVGAKLKSHDAIGFLVAPGQQDDRHGGTLPQPAGQLHAVFAGQFQVEKNEVDRFRVEDSEHVAPRLAGTDTHVVVAQILGDQIANIAIIVDDENVGRSRDVHGCGTAGDNSPRAGISD